MQQKHLDQSGKWARAPDGDCVSVDAALWWLQSPLEVKNLKVLLVPPSPGQVLATPLLHPPPHPPTPPPPPSVWPVLSESVQRAVSPSFRLFQKRKLSLCELFASPLPQWEPRRLPRLQPGAPSSTVHTLVVDGGVDGTPPHLPASIMDRV